MALSSGKQHSYARPEFAVVTRTFLKLFVDFDRSVIRGEVTLVIKRKRTCKEIILDNYGLTIFDVTNYRKKSLKYTIGHHNKFGSEFIIQLPKAHFRPVEFEKIDRIYIKYETNQNSPALYWLRPNQTSDDTNPFLISNSKFTFARAIFPCQDTPSVKSCYTAEISVPLNFEVLIYGLLTNKTRKLNRHIFQFRELKSIPSYSMFIVVGLLKPIPLDSISSRIIRLWVEEKYIQQGINVYREIKHILQRVKKFYGHFLYDSNSYDVCHICILPPNIPEFEIEYPTVIFVSSTLFGVDCSLIYNIITRNIVESFIGNLVKCANFEHLWLTKSFSTFISRKIMRDMFDEEMEIFLKMKGINDLKNMIKLYHNTDFMQTLVPNLTDSLPIDTIKFVPYEKGCLLLNYLENLLGGPKDFESYLKAYLKKFKFKSINTDNWKNHLCQYFSEKNESFFHVLNSISWDTWFYGLDLSHVLDHFTIVEIECHHLAEQWITKETLEELSPVISKLIHSDDLTRLEFLAYLHASPTIQPIGKLRLLQYAYPVDQLKYEVQFLWLRLCIKSKWLEMVGFALEFACHYCMPKFACPIFRDLYEMSQTCELTRTRNLAISWFKNKKCKMLSETVIEVASIFNIDLNDLNE